MASGTPVGNMIIKVDLDSMGLEKSMTGLQRQLKSSNRAMGAQLSAFDRGEKSSRKYGVMIEGLTNRHRIQARIVEEARAKYNQMATQYGENSVKAQKAAQDLNKEIALYEETGRELENVSAEFKEFQRVQEIQSKGWYKVADGMDKFGGKLKASGQAMDTAGRKMTRGVTVPLGIVGGLAIKTGADFEEGMSRVGAVSGESADNMKKLEAKAREMGATTVFSAKDASDAFYYMSLAGWKADDMIDGISGTMDLAAASGEDLASVSDILTDGLTAFGLKAKDSGRMADVLAASSSNANTDVRGLGNAFKYAAPVAGALGYTIEDTTKAIGLMANAGIKGEKAGTALRTMMTNLSKPTKAMKTAMNKYGISLTDANGEMKSFDRVMLDLRKNLGKLDKQQQAAAAATIFGKEAMSGALAIINASEEDYNKLGEAIEGSEGAAKEMAKTMQDNLKGSVKELKSMLEDLFITMYKNLKPTLETIIQKAKDLTQWFANLSPKTQENIVKFGLLAAAMGPVLSITGKLTMGVGGLMQGAGALTKTIGMANGKGTAAALGMLSKAGVAGLAIAGVTGLSVAVYKSVKASKEAEKVNLDVAESLDKQASSLESSADTFDKLSNKAKISNAQLAELNDLNKRISESSNPGEIQELQKQYDALAKKSGLSKDELQKLFQANSDIIEQSPNVEKSVSSQGNAFAKNTDAVREYIDSLRESTLIELEGQRSKALAQEKELREQITAKQKELNGLLDEMGIKNAASQLSAKENKARQEEINKLLQDRTISAERGKKLQQELTALMDVENGDHATAVDRLQEKIDKKRESISNTQEEIDKNKALEQQMGNLVLKQAGITAEGEKGLIALDKSIAKNEQEMAKLDAKLEKNGKLTVKEQERYDALSKTNQKQQEAKQYLNEELGLYASINSLAEAKLGKLSAEKQKRVENLAKTRDIKVEEGNIVKQLENKNKKLLEERQKHGANKKEIDKQIAANDTVLVKILDELGLWGKVGKNIDLASDKIGKKNKVIDAGTGRLKNQGSQLDANNSKTSKGIGLEEKRTKEAGRSVNKKVTAQDHGTVAAIDKRATTPKTKKITAKDFGSIATLDRYATLAKTKKVTVTDAGSVATLNRNASSPVTKTINFVAKGLNLIRSKFWAKGTPPSGHPGGHAVLGDGGGAELAQLPDGRTFLSASTPTLYPNLPKGTHVIPHRETARLLKSVKHYANGTKDYKNSELMKLLALNVRRSETTVDVPARTVSGGKDYTKELLDATLQQNEILMQLLAKDSNTYLDSRSLGRGLEPVITELQGRNKKVRDSFA